MSDKSYVGMTQCFYCGCPKDIIIDRRLRDTLPRLSCVDKEPCPDCASYMQQGIMFVSVKDGSNQENPYRTGCVTVLTEEAVKRIFEPEMYEQLKKTRFGFIEDQVWDLIGLPRGKQEDDT